MSLLHTVVGNLRKATTSARRTSGTDSYAAGKGSSSRHTLKLMRLLSIWAGGETSTNRSSLLDAHLWIKATVPAERADRRAVALVSRPALNIGPFLGPQCGPQTCLGFLGPNAAQYQAPRQRSRSCTSSAGLAKVGQFWPRGMGPTARALLHAWLATCSARGTWDEIRAGQGDSKDFGCKKVSMAPVLSKTGMQR